MNLSSNDKKAISELSETLRAQGLGLVELRLFGSKARGDFDVESDIDIAVILRKVDSRLEQKIFDICFDISLRCDVLLSPIVLSISEMNSSKHNITPFFKTLKREGIAV